MGDDEKSFQQILRKVRDETGFNLEQYRESYIKRRLTVRMRVCDANDYQSYYKILRTDPAEPKKMVEELSINVTRFFRDLSAWDYLKDNVLAQVIAAKDKAGDRRIRMWSAGCSYCEEAYTISMILHELLGPRIADYKIEILASDFDQEALDIAEKAVFDETHFTETPQRYMDKYLSAYDEKYKVADRIRDLVTLRRHDLISGQKFQNMDLIFCRNVVIYFGEELKRRLYLDFYNGLKQGGYLMIGKTELLVGPARENFDIISTTERIYRKP
jgi:chemotaxis protein methyltransferase CheR